MGNPTVRHTKVTNAPADPTAMVDGPAWDATHTVTGLENVDNTSDVNKPVSAAQAAADAVVAATATAATALKANIASPTLTGVPAAPTAAPATNTTQIANTAFVEAARVILAAADALKAPLASPALTGVPTAPTATLGNNTTQIATTAFVLANSAAGGVTSIAGNTGAFTLNSASGVTNNVNDIILQKASASQFGAIKVDNVSIKATGGVIATNGARVLLNTLTGATLSDTTSFTAAFSDYEIVLENIIPATAGTNLELQVHSGGAFQATSYITETQANSAGAATFAQNTTFIQLSSNQNNVGPGISGTIRVFGPVSGASLAKQWTAFTGGQSTTAAVTVMSSGYWNNTAAIDGFQLLFNSGAITSGTVKIYGIS